MGFIHSGSDQRRSIPSSETFSTRGMQPPAAEGIAEADAVAEGEAGDLDDRNGAGGNHFGMRRIGIRHKAGRIAADDPERDGSVHEDVRFGAEASPEDGFAPRADAGPTSRQRDHGRHRP